MRIEEALAVDRALLDPGSPRLRRVSGMASDRRTAKVATCARGLSLAWPLGLLLLTAGAAEAAPARIPIPETLKRSAMGCLAEALRLCPDALAAKDHGVACILGKRRLLSRECQGLAEQALRFLNGQDVHIDLRPRKPVR